MNGGFSNGVPGQQKDSPYSARGLDFPPPQNAHGVEGLDFPPPPPPDMSSYVPYGGHESHEPYLPQVEVSVASSSTAHDPNNSGHLAVGYGTDGFGGELHPNRYSNSNGDIRSGGNSSAHSPNTSVGGLDDVYDAYLNTSTHSPDMSQEQRHSYMMSDYPANGSADKYQHGSQQGSPYHGGEHGGFDQYQNFHGSPQAHDSRSYAEPWQQQQQHHQQQQSQTAPNQYGQYGQHDSYRQAPGQGY